MDGQIASPKGGIKLMAGIAVALVIFAAFVGFCYYILLQPPEGEVITSAAEANQKIFDLQVYLEAMVDDLSNISEEL